MAKRLFLLICLVLTGVVVNPGVLVSSHEFEAKSPNYDALNDIILVKKQDEAKKAELEAEKAKLAEISVVAPVSSPAPVGAPVASVATPAMLNYTVTYMVGSVSEYMNTYTNLSYGMIYRFQKLVYGHNSATLLGSLASLGVGQTFTVSEGGVTKTYRVAAVVVYNKTGNTLENNPSLMSQIAYGAMGHSVALMTCAGQMLGRGDATQRLVVYADLV